MTSRFPGLDAKKLSVFDFAVFSGVAPGKSGSRNKEDPTTSTTTSDGQQRPLNPFKAAAHKAVFEFNAPIWGAAMRSGDPALLREATFKTVREYLHVWYGQSRDRILIDRGQLQGGLALTDRAPDSTQPIAAVDTNW